MTSKLKTGKTYNVTHCRKGSFTIKVIVKTDLWVTGLIVEGETNTLLPENKAFKGDEESFRISFLTKIEEVK